MKVRHNIVLPEDIRSLYIRFVVVEMRHKIRVSRRDELLNILVRPVPILEIRIHLQPGLHPFLVNVIYVLIFDSFIT